MQLGESLKQWREYRHFTIAELARVSHVEYHTIYRTERGNHSGMRWDDLYKVANALGIETLDQIAQGAPQHDD